MLMDKNEEMKILSIIVVSIGAVFVGLKFIAREKKPASVYMNYPEQRNPLQGKKVVFIPDEAEIENADGVRGYLEAKGDSDIHTSLYDRYLKRILDIILSFGGLIALSPIYAFIAIAIKIDDPGPVLFTQKRIGRNKEYFTLHKFRSMKMSTPHDVPTHMLEKPEQYITRVGKFLRKHSLDELPQIWDIFIGNMSVIGPRPALWNQDLLTAERDKYGANDVKPGLTGWAQINGRDELEIPKKAQLDGEYVCRESLLFDIKCFLGTVSKIRHDDSMVEGGNGNKKNKTEDYKEHITNIQGKRILFFSPAFFGYEDKIADKMKKMGAVVDMYDVRCITKAMDRALLKIFPDIFSKRSKIYYEKIIAENRDKVYDYILIVKCDMTPRCILKKMREVFPNAKLCLYLWDSIANVPRILEKINYFDTIHSFDINDCKKYSKIKFRPLFYADEFCKDSRENENYKYDISFIGTIHSDRYKVIGKIKNYVKKEELKHYWYCYLQSRFVYKFYMLTRKEFKKTTEGDFSFRKLDSSEISRIVKESKTIIDIQHPRQSGLTMRTIEMLGMNKKLITTNATIKQYDFYNPSNILVIDRDKIEIDVDFLKQDYVPVPMQIYRKYSLEEWILEVLC